MPAVSGILETALYVADLERARSFYCDLFGFEVLMADERMSALNVAGRDVLLLFKIGASNQDNPAPGGIIPAHDAQGRIHFAFAISRDAEQVWREELAKRQITVDIVTWPGSGISIYFRDPDGHLVELATPGIWTIY